MTQPIAKFQQRDERNSFFIDPPTHRHAYVLSAGANATVTMPSGFHAAILTSTQDFWWHPTSAEEPESNITDGTASIFVPAGVNFRIDEFESFSIAAPSTGSTIVTVWFYRAELERSRQ